MRRLSIKLGNPCVLKARMITQEFQALLDFIAIRLFKLRIEHFSFRNCNFAKSWRFFLVSKNNIVRDLCKFLSVQTKLRSIDFTGLGLNAPNGMTILRTLKCSPCRHTVQRICLHGFFHDNYRATHGNRFSILLYTSMLRLEELSIDARHLDAATLQRLTERSTCHIRLRQLNIIIRSKDKVQELNFKTVIKEEVWKRVRETCPNLRVSVFLCGWLNSASNLKTMWPDIIPLASCSIHWKP